MKRAIANCMVTKGDKVRHTTLSIVAKDGKVELSEFKGDTTIVIEPKLLLKALSNMGLIDAK